MRLRENIEKNVCPPPLIQWGGGEDISQDFSAPPPGIAQAGDNSWEVGGTIPQTGISQGGGDTPLSPPPVPALVYDLNSFTFYTLYA